MQAQWVQTNGPANWNVLCLTISANSILAGIRTGGLFRSTNNGIIWEQVHNGFTANLTNTFVVQGDSIFAGTNDGIFLSTDEGINWAQIGLHGYTIYSIAVSHNYIFAGTDFSGMFLSSDNGSIWAELNNGQPKRPVLSLTVCGEKIFAGIQQPPPDLYEWPPGFYFSTNFGTTWDTVNTNLVHSPGPSAMAVNGTNIFANLGGLYLSTNEGTTWKLVYKGVSTSIIPTVACIGTNIFASTLADGVSLSTNNGTNWTSIGLTEGDVTAFTFSKDKVFAGTNGQGIWWRSLAELITNVSTDKINLPQVFNIFQNYPNPFNPSTVISYSLPSASNIKLVVYNTLGQIVKVLENVFKNAGSYSINFNTAELPSGVYFYKIEAGHFTQVKKMNLIK